MSIRHDRITLTSPDKPVFFAGLMDVSCSICAPSGMTREQIEKFANENTRRSVLGRWVVVDAARITHGGHTPNPCNQVDGRVHWFLMSEGMTKGLDE